jgi:hypothetical protein
MSGVHDIIYQSAISIDSAEGLPLAARENEEAKVKI